MPRFGDLSHFEKTYGLPAGRRRLSTINLEDLYEVKKVIDGGDQKIGGLNQGIYGVRCKATGDRKVHKKIPGDHPGLVREITLLQVLKHPNIVQYHDAYITRSIPPEIGLFMEYYEKGSLRKLIGNYATYNQENQGHQPIYMPESFVWHVLHSLTSALQYIHHGIKSSDRRDPPRPMDPRHWPVILHRDIKPDNILLHHAPIPEERVGRARVYPHWPFNTNDFEYSKTTFPKIVLADFGVATQYDEPDFRSKAGTANWMPPEPESTARGDVWAVGAVALSLCRLLRAGPIPPVPDGHRDPAAWAAKPQLRQGLEHMGAGSSYSNELDCVLRDTLRFDPRDRPRSYQLMALIRKGEAAVLRPGMVPVTNLPKWAFAKR